MESYGPKPVCATELDATISHEYEEFPGGHDWGYWDLHVRQAIAFHVRNLRLGGDSAK